MREALLSWCAACALSAAVLVVFAWVRPRHPALRVVWTALLLSEAIALPLLGLAWRSTRFIVPFLGPPVRIGMLPVWWAAAAVALGYVAALVDLRRWRWMALLPPLHAVWAAVGLWR